MYLPAFLVMPRTACLDDVYCTIFGVAMYELHEPRLIITPRPISRSPCGPRPGMRTGSCVFIIPLTARRQSRVPLTLTFQKRSNSAIDASEISLGSSNPTFWLSAMCAPFYLTDVCIRCYRLFMWRT